MSSLGSEVIDVAVEERFSKFKVTNKVAANADGWRCQGNPHYCFSKHKNMSHGFRLGIGGIWLFTTYKYLPGHTKPEEKPVSTSIKFTFLKGRLLQKTRCKRCLCIQGPSIAKGCYPSFQVVLWGGETQRHCHHGFDFKLPIQWYVKKQNIIHAIL